MLYKVTAAVCHHLERGVVLRVFYHLIFFKVLIWKQNGVNLD